jgi:hypothetical protein
MVTRLAAGLILNSHLNQFVDVLPGGPPGGFAGCSLRAPICGM